MMILKKTIYKSTSKEKYSMGLLKKEEKQCVNVNGIVQLSLIIYYIITKVVLNIKILVGIMTQKVFLI